jgi:hypothetical protein
MVWIDLLIFCLGPVVVLGTLVATIHWILDRIFGTESYEIGFAQRMQADFFQKADVFAARKSREEKYSPHYDALVDEEWRSLRLEDETSEPETDEELSLAQLLERKR